MLTIFCVIMAVIGSGGLMIYANERVHPLARFPYFVGAAGWLVFMAMVSMAGTR